MQVVRESHWAVGWVEWIAIHQDDERACQIADDLRDHYNDYPVVDESDYSDLEWNEAADYWEGMSPRDRVAYAMQERKRYHWLAKESVWIYGRYDYPTLANYGSTISEAICESLRS